MIYDGLERELEKYCNQLGVEMKGIDQLDSICKIRLCLRCGKPFPPKTHWKRKYHVDCEQKERNERARKKYAQDPEPVLNAVRKYRATFKRCSCCGLRPVGEGLHFLCNMCFEWDGPDWIAEQNAQWEEKRREREARA